MEQNEIMIKLLNIIHKNPELSRRKLSKSIGILTGKTNYIIKALIEKGIIKTENF